LRIYTTKYDSPLGTITLTSNGTALTALRFSNECPVQEGASVEVFDEVRRWLDSYFSGQIPAFMPPLALEGTDFQLHVWKELQTIPYGQTVSYGEIARRIKCRSSQAVGGAVGHNPVALIIPCHRVVGSDGSLTGYAYGLDKKQRLLELERYNKGKLNII